MTKPPPQPFRTETLPASSLNPAPYNPRRMPPEEMEALVTSLREYGMVEPIVCRAEDRVVIGGHQRREAWITLHGPDAPTPCVLLTGLTESKTRALNLALNKIGGSWDFQKLSEVLASLEDDAIGLTGFSEAEVEDILKLTDTAAAQALAATKSLDDELAAAQRRFEIEVTTDEEAAACRDALRAYGGTGPNTVPEAFVKLCRAAFAARPTPAEHAS